MGHAAAANCYFILFCLDSLKTDLLINSKSFSYSDLNPFTYNKIDKRRNFNKKLISKNSSIFYKSKFE